MRQFGAKCTVGSNGDYVHRNSLVSETCDRNQTKETPVNERHLSRVQSALNRAMDPSAILAIARSTGFCQRLRSVAPHEVVVALVAAMATRTTETIADIVRVFNTVTEHGMAYKPFHNKLAKPAFPEFMRLVVSHLLDELVSESLRPEQLSALAMFDDILLQDGTSFGVSAALKDVFPGRYTTQAPAAVELHATMSLWCDHPVSLAIAADTEGERVYLPEPHELRNQLIIGDRGYQDVDYCREVDAHGGYVLIRAQLQMNPVIIESYVDGKLTASHRGRRLREIVNKQRRKTIDIDAQWLNWNRPDTRLRVVFLWNKKRKEYLALVTNLDRKSFPPDMLMDLYRLRWQVELLFKEWKSYCNLHAFTTTKAPIAEGLMWASLAACIVQRFMAKATQRVFGHAEISTRKTAMTVGHHLFVLLSAVLAADGVREALRKLMRHLDGQARRSHPKRDRKTGRLTLGIEPVLG